MFGARANQAISILIALSAIGNVLAVLFSQGRINQELGREGVLPWSKFWASNKPFNSPLAGLTLQWAVTLIIILAVSIVDAIRSASRITDSARPYSLPAVMHTTFSSTSFPTPSTSSTRSSHSGS